MNSVPEVERRQLHLPSLSLMNVNVDVDVIGSPVAES